MRQLTMRAASLVLFCNNGVGLLAVRSCPQAGSKARRRTTPSYLSSASGQADRRTENRAEVAGKSMEVEVKLRLPTETDYKKVLDVLGANNRQATYAQENYFFDGSNQELSSQRVVLRVRWYNGDEKAVITLKGRQILRDGIGQATEVEASVDPQTARRFLSAPTELLNLDIPLVQDILKGQFGIQGLTCMGGFNNLRFEYPWGGEVLEVDRTEYSWGTLYEIECETVHPETLRDELGIFLQKNDISYKYSTTTKFANFVNKTLE